MNKQQKTLLTIILIASIIVIDQVVKFLVKTHMYIGEDIPLIGDWCLLHFVENEGFAFGTVLGGNGGKLFLSLFRLVMAGVIGWYIVRSIRNNGRTSLIVCLSLIMAGAVGNLIDSCFYGLIFSESTYRIATLFPPEGGYGTLLFGKVVDMFYFPLFEFTWPEWLPFIGGNHGVFFSAIFNIADVAITIGMIWLIIELIYTSKKEKTEPETALNTKNIVKKVKSFFKRN